MGEWLIGIYVFVLAMLLGFELITRVPPTLHTPLMSGANAISGMVAVRIYRRTYKSLGLPGDGSDVTDVQEGLNPEPGKKSCLHSYSTSYTSLQPSFSSSA